jgi:hypothetical protein
MDRGRRAHRRIGRGQAAYEIEPEELAVHGAVVAEEVLLVDEVNVARDEPHHVLGPAAAKDNGLGFGDARH